jgi:hypothetical protein
MTSKELEFIDLTNKQYEELVKIQMEAYKKVVSFCTENISEPEKIKIIDNNISKIEEEIIGKLEEMRVYNKIFSETVK